MKFFFLIPLFILISCSQEHHTEKNNSSNIPDSLVISKEISMYNKPYRLKIVKYNADNGSAHITLTQNDRKVLEKKITKEIFKDSLNTSIYKEAVLHEVDYDFVRTNRIYFKAILTTANTAQKFELAIFYQTDKKGQLDFWKAEQ